MAYKEFAHKISQVELQSPIELTEILDHVILRGPRWIRIGTSLLFSTPHSTGDRTPLRPTASRPRACCPLLVLTSAALSSGRDPLSPETPLLPTSFSPRDPAAPRSSARRPRALPPVIPLPRVSPPGIPPPRSSSPSPVRCRPVPREKRRRAAVSRTPPPGIPRRPSLAVVTAAGGCIRRFIICIRAVSVRTVLLRLFLLSLASPRRTPLLPRPSLPAPSRQQVLYQPYTPSRPRRLWGVGAPSALLLPPPSARDPHLAIRPATSPFLIFCQAHALNFIHGTANRQ